MNAYVKTITKEIALDILQRNSHNRPLSKAHLSHLCSQLKNGEWKLNGDAIRYNDDMLIDGQHRLTAIVTTGIPMQTLVIEGLDSGVFDTIDTGKNRSNKDTLALLGEKDALHLSSALLLVHSYNNGFVRKHVSNIGIQTLLKDNIEIKESMYYGHKCKHILPRSVGTGLHYLFKKKHGFKADAFFDQLSSGVGLVNRSPILTLRDKILRIKHESNMKIDQKTIAWYTVKAINLFVSNKLASKIIIVGDEFPKIID